MKIQKTIFSNFYAFKEVVLMKVDEFIKIDLHIHSEASQIKSGDEKIVKGMNKENVDLLLQKLEENYINVFAITDHNTFDFELYSTIKKKLSKSIYNYIQNIIPAVEFDLEFDSELYKEVNRITDSNEKKNLDNKIHVIALFNDSDSAELKKLSKNLGKLYEEKLESINRSNIEKGMSIPKKNINVAFSENDLTKYFKSSNVNFILIAHQKGPYLPKNNITENDFTNLDEEIKDKLLLIKYFDALEFKQLRSNISLKSYLKYEAINFISGSDCHNWNFYPANTELQLKKYNKHIKEGNNKRFEHTYLKCDSSFEGIKIALTGDADSRIYLNKPNVEDREYLENISVKVSNDTINIPLSYGVNAIIGNNTSGKSLLLNTVFGELDENKDPSLFCNKYKFWPNKEEFTDLTFDYTHQGEIVNKFSKDKELEKEFQGKFKDIDYTEFDEIILSSADKMLSKIKYNTDIYNGLDGVNVNITLPSKELKPYQLVITGNPINVTLRNKRVITKLKTVIEKLLEVYPKVHLVFKTEMDDTLTNLIKVYKYYVNNLIKDIKEKSIVDAFKQGILDYNNLTREGETLYSDTNQFLNINELTLKIQDNFIALMNLKKVKVDSPIEKGLIYKTKDSEKQEGDFKFIKSSDIILTEKVVEEILISPFKSKNTLNEILEMTVEQAIDSLVENSTDIVNSAALNERYKAILQQRISNKYRKVTLSIVDSEKGLKNQSPGKNAITYLNLKNISATENIYVIDQPEDQIGPTDIREKLKKILRKLATKSQIIMITHNPYLVVNLDVDNVIQLDNTSGKMDVNFGALYHKNNGNIIDIIANSLEGGYEAIKERIDRYERNTDKTR